MSTRFIRKLALALICFVVLILVVFMFKGVGIENYRDNKVVAGEIRRPWDIFAAHISRPQYLTIAGRTYLGVRGQAPYYLDVPDTNSVLFVTQSTGDHVTFHILNLNTKKDVEIDGGTSGFGWGIGGSRKPGDKFTDYIESADSDRITVSIRSGDWKETMVLNLASKSIERRETLYLDANGQVTNRSVQTNPAPPRR